jgi:hypothetical protein
LEFVNWQNPFVMKEAVKSKNGDHSKWRNYDDINEFFWWDTLW